VSACFGVCGVVILVHG